ncbi:NUDIX domain protein [Mycobacterium avium MAV_120809_2495]|nr:NUDIX domain protein [Mycobacterium avium MAV_120809_2495]
MSVRDSVLALLTQWDPPDAAQDSLRHAVLAFVHARPTRAGGSASRHVTASTLVLDHTGDRVLLTLHRRLAGGAVGGHCDDDDAGIVAAALREATEESGIDGLRMAPGWPRCTCIR